MSGKVMEISMSDPAADLILIVTTDSKGHIVNPHVHETRDAVDSIVDIIKSTDTSDESAPQKTNRAAITFDTNYLADTYALKRIYELQVDRELYSPDRFLLDPEQYQLSFMKDIVVALDDEPHKVQIIVWDRIEQEIELVF